MEQSEGSGMREGWYDRCAGKAHTRSYRQPGGLLKVLGAVMIAAGLVLLFLCIPGWFWAAMAGAALIAGGCLLLMLGNGR